MTNAGRASRADEVRNERRRKPGSTVHYGLKLSVPEEQLDRTTYEYRWVNDSPGRVQRMKDEDWDPAPEASNGASVEKRVVGTDAGKPTSGILMRKRKDWYGDDQKEKMRPLNEMDAEIRRGKNHERTEPGMSGPEIYTPGGVNTIDSGAPSGVSIKG